MNKSAMPAQLFCLTFPRQGKTKGVIEHPGFSVWINGSLLCMWREARAVDRVGIVGHLFGEIIGPLKIG